MRPLSTEPIGPTQSGVTGRDPVNAEHTFEIIASQLQSVFCFFLLFHELLLWLAIQILLLLLSLRAGEFDNLEQSVRATTVVHQRTLPPVNKATVQRRRVTAQYQSKKY